MAISTGEDAGGSFADFIRRIRAGDDQAAAELVRQYEAAVRLEVRLRLRDRRLRRVFDSMDVCQSVLGTFFVRAAAGQYDLDEPAQLLKLLVAIARNKVAYEARKETAGRRDHRRADALDAGAQRLAGREPSPSRCLSARELLQAFRERFTEEERRLAELRGQGRDWAAIAAELGGTPAARRMQLKRAADRVARELGLEEVCDG
jgi:RNA polymerase sigma-70 factor (ECF subfamily)